MSNYLQPGVTDFDIDLYVGFDSYYLGEEEEDDDIFEPELDEELEKLREERRTLDSRLLGD